MSLRTPQIAERIWKSIKCLRYTRPSSLSFDNTYHSASSHNSTTHGFLYEPLEGIERFENYRPGGYHPVKIGDHFHGRYSVVHKLGHGSYSTTWLAHDEQMKRYVAVKVCTADSNPREIDILSSLTSARFPTLVERLSRRTIPSILDRFSLHGPNGLHQCYVTTPARTSLSGAKDESWTRLFQLDVARALAAQVTIAVAYVHDQGIVHGDLHLGNILLEMPVNFDQLSIDSLYKQYGEPGLDPVLRFDGKSIPSDVPTHGVVPIWLGEASEKVTLMEARALLTDFGEAFSPSLESKYESRTPLVVRPPEAWFEPTTPLSFPSDIWSLACTIWGIIAQRNLFEGFLATQDDMTCEHVDALGILPPERWEKWEARPLKFTNDGTPIGRNPYRSWEDRFEDSVQQPREESGMARIGLEETSALFVMLKSMLSFRPEDRLTARQVLESEWMVRWALPAYGRIDDRVGR